MAELLRFGATTLELIEGRAVDFPSEAMLTTANARGIMASGNAGALRLLAGAELERALQASGPLLVGQAYVTEPGQLAARGVARVVHAVINAQPGEPSKRAAVARALAEAFDLLAERGTRSLTLPDVGLRVPNIGVGEAAALLTDALIARIRRGAPFEQVRIASLEPAYLRACRASIIERGGRSD